MLLISRHAFVDIGVERWIATAEARKVVRQGVELLNTRDHRKFNAISTG
jgi:hypothetical protein